MVFKRCFWFDRDGNPLRKGGGCPRKASCLFVHPNDPDWDDAPSSFPPPHIRQRRSSPPDTRKYEPPISPIERDKSTSRHKSRRSPSPRRQRSRDRSEGEASEMSRRQSSDHQRRPETSRRDDKAPPSAVHTKNTVPPSSGVGVQMAPPPVPPLATPSVPQPQPPLDPPPPPPPPSASSVSAFPPPPPLPTGPFWQKKPPSTHTDPTPEEARMIWLERIKLMTDCLRNEKQLKQLRKDVADAKRDLARQRAETLPEEDQKKKKAQLAILESQRDEMEKTVEKGMLRLIKSKSWPMAPQPAADEGEVAKSQEMINYLNVLTDKAAEMYKVLLDIQERNALPPAGPTTEMDVDPQGSSSRPLKRRRLSESIPSTQAQPQPSPQEIEALRDKVLSIEARFSAFKNDLDVHDAELAEVMDERVDAKLEALHLGQIAVSTVSQDEYREVQENVKKTGADMDELAIEIVDLITRTTAQEAEKSTIRRENETLKGDFKRLQDQFQKHEANREKHRATIEALEAAISAHVTQPPSPPGSPRMPTRDYILEELEEPILDMVRTHTKPLIETMRSQIEDLLRIQNKEMYDIFSNKLTLTLRTVETISGRIGAPERSNIVVGS